MVTFMRTVHVNEPSDLRRQWGEIIDEKPIRLERESNLDTEVYHRALYQLQTERQHGSVVKVSVSYTRRQVRVRIVEF